MKSLAVALVVIYSIGMAASPDPPLAPHQSLTDVAKIAGDRRAVELNLVDARKAESGASAIGSSAASSPQYLRAKICKVGEAILTTPLNGTCLDADAMSLVFDCAGDVPLLPLWMRSRPSEEAPWSEWTGVDLGGCPADVLPVLTEADFRRLPLAAPILHLQPDRGWVLVNMDTIVSTDKTEQTFRTDLLGHGIDVIATPDSFTYEWGDGTTPLATHSAGHAYPNQDTFHAYTDLGTRQITLTTTWTARYRVDGTTQWRDVIGTAATSATSGPFTIEERRSHLVAELCTATPTPPDCKDT